MKRREFLQTTAGVVLISYGCSGCSAFSGVSDMDELSQDLMLLNNGEVKILLDDVPKLKEKGYGMKFKVSGPDKEIKLVLVHANDDQFYALENKCTHGGRELEYKTDDEIMRCTSFGHSKFELDGDKVKGPADGDVLTFPVSLYQNEMVITIA
ncbi:Rieske (2Fe-2S) protein [Bacteroidota bacterium]